MFSFFINSIDLNIIFNAIGVFGSFMYICGFGLVQTQIICGNGIKYCLIQISAATCVLISLQHAFNLASFLIQISFATIGILGLMSKLRQRKNTNELMNPDNPAKQTPLVM